MKTQPMELVPQASAPPTRSQDVASLVNMNALLEKAIDAKSAVEVMERLQAMRREVRAEQAKEAFDRSMAAFQAECPIITKNKDGARNAYRFASLDHIVEQTRGLLQKHGFSFSITSEIEPGWVKAICKITHEGGHSQESVFKCPVDSKNPMQTDPQKYGAAMTFAKRYSFANAFGILTADEDLDGRDKAPKPAGPARPTQSGKERLIQRLADIKDKALQYAIDHGIIMPDEGLEAWPMGKVPATQSEYNILRKAIEAHQ